MSDLILVTGTPRSGVSVVAGVLHLCGAWGGRMSKNPSEFDGRGSFENADVRSSMMAPFFQGIDADPRGQRPLPNHVTCQHVGPVIQDVWRRRFDKIATAQGYVDGSRFYASPRTCLVWPVWQAAFPDAKWIIVRRADEEIIDGCMATGYMDAYTKQAGWARWLDGYKWRFSSMVDAGLDVHQIWAHRMIGGHLGELRELVESLGLEWDSQRVEDFIAPILWKGGVFEVVE